MPGLGQEPLSAEADLLRQIEFMMASQANLISIPFSKLNQAVAGQVQSSNRLVTRMQSKLLQRIAKNVVTQGNVIDAAQTTVLNGLNQYQADTRNLLTYLASKSGMVGPGDPLESALVNEIVDAPRLTYEGTLVLAVKEAVPWLERIAAALERIADRLSPLENDDLEPTPGDPEAVDSADDVDEDFLGYWKN